MRLWLSRAWLALVGLSAVFIALIWFGVMVERLGWRLVVGVLGLALLSRFAARKSTNDG